MTSRSPSCYRKDVNNANSAYMTTPSPTLLITYSIIKIIIFLFVFLFILNIFILLYNKFDNFRDMGKQIKIERSAAKIIWLSWSIAMLLLLYFCVDRVFGYNILSFEVFVGLMLFFIVILLLIIFGWILHLRNRQKETFDNINYTLRKICEHF
jgi:fatty acid desaturase